jgi:radical SAM superfamily enzyme YgiQ (UPF0313 family)
MKICLVTTPIATGFEDAADAASRQVRIAAEAPQLGILTLAASLEQSGILPELFNCDEAYCEFLESGEINDVANFAGWAAERLAEVPADIFGFGTICSSYPLTIRMAEALKQRVPRGKIVLGGPQASVVDRQTLAAFPFVDMILRGEADRTLAMLLAELDGAGRLSSVPGLTYRSPFGVQRSEEPPLIEDLDSLPLPAYHLTRDLEDSTYASLELGRGCPFACTFCSTNDFFRRRFRVKSPRRMRADMRTIAGSYGIRSFNLVHDMFTVDRRRVVAFCREMIDSGENFAWTCSARTDSVDDELLTLMARARCDGIFFGVETGSSRMQKLIDKCLDLDKAKTVIQTTGRLKIPTAVSLITGFPEETEDDLRGTVGMFMYSMQQPCSTPQLNVLAPLAGTPLHLKYRDRMVLEDLCSDMSHSGRLQNEADRELIRQYPDIFPNFYMLRSTSLDIGSCLELREFCLMLLARLRWLGVAIHQSGNGMLDVFKRWQQWRKHVHPELSGGAIRHYYTLEQSRNDFLDFVRARLEYFPSPAVSALLEYHEILVEAASAAPAGAVEGKPVSGAILPSDVPVRRTGVHVIEMDWDIQAAIDGLKSGHAATLIRCRKAYRTGESVEGYSRLFEITPLVARALKSCDRRRAELVIGDLAGEFNGDADLQRHGGKCLLEKMRDASLIEILRPVHLPVDKVSLHRSVRRRRRSKDA